MTTHRYSEVYLRHLILCRIQNDLDRVIAQLSLSERKLATLFAGIYRSKNISGPPEEHLCHRDLIDVLDSYSTLHSVSKTNNVGILSLYNNHDIPTLLHRLIDFGRQCSKSPVVSSHCDDAPEDHPTTSSSIKQVVHVLSGLRQFELIRTCRSMAKSVIAPEQTSVCNDSGRLLRFRTYAQIACMEKLIRDLRAELVVKKQVYTELLPMAANSEDFHHCITQKQVQLNELLDRLRMRRSELSACQEQARDLRGKALQRLIQLKKHCESFAANTNLKHQLLLMFGNRSITDSSNLGIGPTDMLADRTWRELFIPLDRSGTLNYPTHPDLSLLRIWLFLDELCTMSGRSDQLKDDLLTLKEELRTLVALQRRDDCVQNKLVRKVEAIHVSALKLLEQIEPQQFATAQLIGSWYIGR